MRWLLLVTAGLVACSDDVVPDLGPFDHRLEAITPPDFRLDDGNVKANIGAPCDPAKGGVGCTGGAVCLDLGSTGCDLATGWGCGVCALGDCTMENIATTEKEDTCPEGAVCTQVPVAAGSVKTFCLLGCVPSFDSNDSNPCATGSPSHAGVACHPASVVLNDHAEVCLFPACKTDADCGNKDLLNPDSICMKGSGICLSRGNQQALIGGPCTGSQHCGPHQYCLLEQKDAGGKVVMQGGYCTLVGCKYYEDNNSKTDYWRCPSGSKCFYMGSGQFVSFCLATECDPGAPDEADSCRDEADLGQYDCIQLGAEKACWTKVGN